MFIFCEAEHRKMISVDIFVLYVVLGGSVLVAASFEGSFSRGGVKNVTVITGSQIQLTCSLKKMLPCQHMTWVKKADSTHETVSWKFDCKSSMKSSRFHFYFVNTSNGSVYFMEIYDVSETDVGAYMCDIGNDVTRSAMPEHVYVVNEWPQPSCHTYPSNPGIGMAVEFTCSIPPGLSSMVPVQWSRSIPSDLGITRHVQSGESFTVNWILTDIDAFDTFTCFVGDNNKMKSCSIHPLKVDLKVLPGIIRKNEGTNATFVCATNSAINHMLLKTFPEHRYEWVVEVMDERGTLQDVKSSDRSNKKFTVADNGKTLRILNLRRTDNRLKVHCYIKLQKDKIFEDKDAGILFVTPQRVPQNSSGVAWAWMGATELDGAVLDNAKWIVIIVSIVTIFFIGVLLMKLSARYIQPLLPP